MTRRTIAGAWYGDYLPSGHFVASGPQLIVTHDGPLSLPPGEPWGVMMPRATDVGGFAFAGQAASTVDPGCWEWTGVWTPHPPPALGISPVIYDRNGVLHQCPNAGGFRYVTPSNKIISGADTYGPWNGLSQWTDLGDGLYIGQQTSGLGTWLWDGTHNRALGYYDADVFHPFDSGSDFLVANRDGETVAIGFTSSAGFELVMTTMAELRAMPIVSAPEPPDPIPPDPPNPEPPDPEPPKPEPPDPQPEPIPPTPQPEVSMLAAYGPIMPSFQPGSEHDNGNGTISVQKPNGQWLCVTPEGRIEERPDPGGVWESFKKGAGCLIAERDGGDRGPLVYVLGAADSK